MKQIIQSNRNYHSAEPKLRHQSGLQSLEFALGLVVLFLFFVFPLVSFGTLLIRWGLAANALNTYTRQLARSESFSQAYYQVTAHSSLEDMLIRLGGVHPLSTDFRLCIINAADSTKNTIIKSPNAIPSSWLPEGSNCPCQYMLELGVEAEIHPLVTIPLGGGKIPGLSAPLKTTLMSCSHWENLGRNPITEQYFVNE